MYILMNYLAEVLRRHWYAGVKEVMGKCIKIRRWRKSKSQIITHIQLMLQCYSQRLALDSS